MSKELTVKFLGPVNHTLQECPAARLADHMTLLLGLLDLMSQREEQRSSNDRENDGPCTEAPSPPLTRKIIELVSNLRSGKCSDDVWRRCESVRKSSVLQLDRISRDDIQTVLHTAKAKLVEDLEIGTVSPGVITVLN